MPRRFILLLLFSLLFINGWGKRLMVGIVETCFPSEIKVFRTYVDAVAKGGNIPIIIPDSPYAGEVVKKIDVLLLVGGEDVQPSLYGETPNETVRHTNPHRDSLEITLIHQAVKYHKAILGICRGLQIINVAFGGSLYQDIPTDFPQSNIHHLNHDRQWKPAHKINISHDSRLYKVLRVDTADVTSSHHQSAKRIADGFKVTAVADDGVVEGIESAKYHATGLQFHPERSVQNNVTLFLRIFKHLDTLTGFK